MASSGQGSGVPDLQPPPNGDVSRGDVVLGVDWMYVSLSILVVAARFYVRKATRSLNIEDWLMFVALLFMIATHGIITNLVHLGLGRHEYYVLVDTPQNVIPLLKNIFVLEFISFYTLAFAKLSIACLLVRMLHQTNPWTIRFIWTNAILFSIITVANMIISLASCTPMKASWDPSVPNAKCLSPHTLTSWAKFLGSYSAFLDMSFALIPIVVVWRLRLAVDRKLGLTFFLGLGVLAGVAACVKTANSSLPADFTYDAVPLYIWSSTEFFLNIFCGCVPTLRPLWDRAWAKKPIQPKSRSSEAKDTADKLVHLRMLGSSFVNSLSSLRSDRFRLRDSRDSKSDGSTRSGSAGGTQDLRTANKDKQESHVSTNSGIESVRDTDLSRPQEEV